MEDADKKVLLLVKEKGPIVDIDFVHHQIPDGKSRAYKLSSSGYLDRTQFKNVFTAFIITPKGEGALSWKKWAMNYLDANHIVIFGLAASIFLNVITLIAHKWPTQTNKIIEQIIGIFFRS